MIHESRRAFLQHLEQEDQPSAPTQQQQQQWQSSGGLMSMNPSPSTAHPSQHQTSLPRDPRMPAHYPGAGAPMPEDDGGDYNYYLDASTSSGPATGYPQQQQQQQSQQQVEHRTSRWGDYAEPRLAPRRSRARYLPLSIPSTLAPEQRDAYIMFFRLDEVAKKLRNNDYIPKPQDRSPSPPPEYGSDGKRTNTLEQRYRRRAEEELHRLCTWGLKNLPNFKAPPEYRRPTKFGEKLMVPVHEYPDINFIGLLIGPRGNTLKKMEADSGARISIRGKGAVKEGKTRADGLPTPGADEDLHCWVSADSEEKIKKAILIIQHIIETAKTVPEGQNQLKQLQLRELASLNGTLRDDMFYVASNTCNNCGAVGHRRFECPEAKNFVNTIICNICGGAGHIARDCMNRNQGRAPENSGMDTEFASLMAELGGGSVPAPPSAYPDDDVPPPPPPPEDDFIPPPPPPEAYGAGQNSYYYAPPPPPPEE